LASSIMQLAFVASSSEFTKERPHKVLWGTIDAVLSAKYRW
jgi:hypothetical protein